MCDCDFCMPATFSALAISELELQDQGQIRRVVFTGDLGRRHQPVLMDPETIEPL